MISEDLKIKSKFQHRDCVAYYFAKWFDEAFCVSILNLLSGHSKCSLASDDCDRIHIDYWYKDEKLGKTFRCDQKTVTKNFIRDGICRDVLTISNSVLKSKTCPDIISFYYKQCIYSFKTNLIDKISHLCVNNDSIGQDGSKQDLVHYDVNDIILISECTKIPERFTKIIEPAYQIYTERRKSLHESLHYFKENNYKDEIKKRELKTMKEQLMNIIKKYNNEEQLYKQESSTPVGNMLNEIYNLINL